MPIYKMDGKKDGKQRYRVRVNYVDDNGNARQTEKVVYGLPEAKEFEKSLTNKIKQPLTSKDLTVQELLDEYLAIKKYEVRESSLDKSKRVLEGHIIPILGSKRLKNLTLPVLREWKKSISEKGLSSTTEKNIFGELRALLNYAVKMEHMDSHSLAKLGNFKDPYEAKKTIKYYTADEYKKFIAKARTHAESQSNICEWNYYVFFNIAFYTGMRKGEINALKWTDIKDNTILVRRSIAQKIKGGDRETPPKNKSSNRDIQLPLPLIKILNEHKARYALVDKFSDEWRICGGQQCLRDSTVNNRNKQFAEAAEVKTIRIHDFRHSHASLLANAGINIQEIARRLGHAKIEITWNVYSHLYPKEEERALKALNEIE